MTEQGKILSIARGEIGVKEYPANSNRVKYNTAYYGRQVNGAEYPWCCAFVWWVFREAKLSNLFYDGEQTAYCPTVLNWAAANDLLVAKNKGKAGDIVLFDWNFDGVADHIGIIEKRNSNGTYSTIEGNTAVGNDSNGGQVMNRIRDPKYIIAIVRPKYTTKIQSTDNIDVDGSWGKITTRATQRVLGTKVDGTVSNQKKVMIKHMPACDTESWKFNSVKTSTGSEMVKSLQKLVGRVSTGLMTVDDIKAMQTFLSNMKYYKGKIDGSMGPLTVKAWQKYINRRLKKW